MPKEYLDTNIINNIENKDKDNYKNRPILVIPIEMKKENINNNNKDISSNTIKNISSDNGNITEIKIQDKKEEPKEILNLSIINKNLDDNKKNKKEETSFMNISNNNVNISTNIIPQKEKVKEKGNEFENIKNNEFENIKNNEFEIIKNNEFEIIKNNIFNNNKEVINKGKNLENKNDIKEKLEISQQLNIINIKEKENENEILNKENKEMKENIEGKEYKDNREFKDKKIQKAADSTIPEGIHNISKDKSDFHDKKLVSFDNKNEINNIILFNQDSKEINNNINLNNKITNINNKD